MNRLIILSIFSIVFSNVKANSIITIEVDGKKISQYPISLTAEYHEIVFRIASPNANQRVEYRLQNIENDWKVADFPAIRYTNLDGGYYVFFVKTTQNKQTVIQHIAFHIKENFWEKWWFWLFLVFFSTLFFSLLIYFWFLYDFRQRMKTEQIRQRIAADLHDEVGANLSSITFLVESLKRKMGSEDANSTFLLEKISNNSTESAILINDTIWALNPTFDTFAQLIERTKSFASSLLSANDIAFSVENNLKNSDFELSIEQRRNLYLIMKEAINNIAKHSEANKAYLKISDTHNGIVLAIEDNGKGYNVNQIYDGNGQNNMKKRAEDSLYGLVIESNMGEGTRLSLYLQKNH